MDNMKTLFNIIVCGHNEILKRYSINEIKKSFIQDNSIAIYDCNKKKDKLRLLLIPEKSKITLIDNFDKLTILQFKQVLKENGCINLLVTRLSNEEVYKWFYKKHCVELYIQLFPYLLDIDDFEKSAKKFGIVRNGLFENLFK